MRMLTRLGGDSSGAAVLATLGAEDVDVSAIEVDADGYTGILLRDSHPSRPVEVVYHRKGSAAAALGAEYVRGAGLDGARLAHVSGITAMLSPSACEAVGELYAAARETGAVISFDPNVRRKLGSTDEWRAKLAPLLAGADLVFAGEDELALAGTNAWRLLDRGALAVVVKHRDRSSEVITADGVWRVPTMATKVVDPIGAGDALASGYLSAWLRGASPDEALRQGVASAAGVVAGVTDIEGLPIGDR